MLSVKRHELKYYISSLNADALAHCLSNILTTDPHTINNYGYPISSLYFDNAYDSSLSEKQAGIIKRKKYRLRIYTANDQHAKLEIKHKLNQQIKKESLVVNRSTAKDLVQGRFSSLNSVDSDPQQLTFYSRLISDSYQPTAIVSYWRQAFIYPAFNIRITIDRFLQGDVTNLDLFKTSETSFPVLMNGRQILEVKYDMHLPGFIRNIIQSTPLERAAISKYTLARRYLKQQKWEDN